jgi:large subunit ribosomal protein L14
MIQTKTNLIVSDNSGAKQVECIKVFPTSKKNNATIGDLIVVSIKKAISKKKIKKGQVIFALIIRVNKNIKRKNDTILRFYDNAVVLVNAAIVPVGTRIFGPVSYELRKHKYMRIISLASFIF